MPDMIKSSLVADDDVQTRSENCNTFSVLVFADGGSLHHTLCHQVDDLRAGGSEIRGYLLLDSADCGLVRVNSTELRGDSTPQARPAAGHIVPDVGPVPLYPFGATGAAGRVPYFLTVQAGSSLAHPVTNDAPLSSTPQTDTQDTAHRELRSTLTDEKRSSR